MSDNKQELPSEFVMKIALDVLTRELAGHAFDVQHDGDVKWLGENSRSEFFDWDTHPACDVLADEVERTVVRLADQIKAAGWTRFAKLPIVAPPEHCLRVDIDPLSLRFIRDKIGANRYVGRFDVAGS